MKLLSFTENPYLLPTSGLAMYLIHGTSSVFSVHHHPRGKIIELTYAQIMCFLVTFKFLASLFVVTYYGLWHDKLHISFSKKSEKLVETARVHGDAGRSQYRYLLLLLPWRMATLS